MKFSRAAVECEYWESYSGCNVEVLTKSKAEAAQLVLNEEDNLSGPPAGLSTYAETASPKTERGERDDGIEERRVITHRPLQLELPSVSFSSLFRLISPRPAAGPSHWRLAETGYIWRDCMRCPGADRVLHSPYIPLCQQSTITMSSIVTRWQVCRSPIASPANLRHSSTAPPSPSFAGNRRSTPPISDLSAHPPLARLASAASPPAAASLQFRQKRKFLRMADHFSQNRLRYTGSDVRQRRVCPLCCGTYRNRPLQAKSVISHAHSDFNHLFHSR